MQTVIDKFEKLLAENLDYFEITDISILEKKSPIKMVKERNPGSFGRFFNP